MNNVNDYDGYMKILNELMNIYNLCRKEIQKTEPLWIIDENLDGTVKEILSNEEYLIQLSDGNVIKKNKSQIIQNT